MVNKSGKITNLKTPLRILSWVTATLWSISFLFNLASGFRPILIIVFVFVMPLLFLESYFPDKKHQKGFFWKIRKFLWGDIN